MIIHQIEQSHVPADEKEHSFIILKPDAVTARICLVVLHELDTALRAQGLDPSISALSVARLTPQQVAEHYVHLRHLPFFQDLVNYMSSHKVWLAVFEGKKGIIQAIREVLGATNPAQAAEGTIRRTYGRVGPDGSIQNVAHASDSQDAADKEVRMFFDRHREGIRETMPELAKRLWPENDDATEN